MLPEDVTERLSIVLQAPPMYASTATVAPVLTESDSITNVHPLERSAPTALPPPIVTGKHYDKR